VTIEDFVGLSRLIALGTISEKGDRSPLAFIKLILFNEAKIIFG
jgi:hypothetical protein